MNISNSEMVKETIGLESYFRQFRRNIIGIDQTFISPYGTQNIIYADWTASGRLYGPIEEKLLNEIGPFVANTHTETSFTGSAMTLAYHKARTKIKQHVNANDDDILITVGTGMTGAVNKLQRILGLKVAENLKEHTHIPDALKPVVFVSHMEHHSNQTSWLETIAKVEVIPCNKEGLICFDSFENLLKNIGKLQLKLLRLQHAPMLPESKPITIGLREQSIKTTDFALLTLHVPHPMSK